ncbi:MAG TPA: DUF91 domain-containing protein [Candidatus Moranbacteria bacterium]|nr:DUF91 domain-containing protein [Candidatus Moranbacteria bacterium]
MKANRQKILIGQKAEELAVNYLLAQGYKILERHYYNKKGYHLGEIDVIAEDSTGKLVFVEVKARRGRGRKVLPEENLTPAKIRKLYRIIEHFLRINQWQERDWRLDAILVNFDFKTRKSCLRQIKFIRL